MAWRQIAARLGVTGVPTVTFDSLGDWFALWITINGWKHNDASTRTFGFQAQSGATLLNNAADYSRGGYTPVVTTMFELCTSVPQNTEIQGSFTIYNFNKTIKKSVGCNVGRKNNNGGWRSESGIIESVLVLDTLIFLNNTGVNFTGGDIRVLADIP